ncbi:hypothetical protein LCGC14_0847100 [marine sediment metagenome]|uniref:RNA ligase domain-containing protein n=1 Tax=marine sediment metagenome TaxID=412755 RepID=A0A0F9PBC1_9ZZZZ
MGFMHIENLYKNSTEMLMFKQVFALEKVHGTSAHVAFKDGTVGYFSGGCKRDSFVELFDNEAMYAAFMALGHDDVVVYGEAYGGKIQKMQHLYGDCIRFVAFDVKVGETWLDVPNAADVVRKLGLEFVPYEKVNSTVEALDYQRDAYSVLGERLGMERGTREGIVIRPLVEITNSKGQRVMSKHKGAAFSEHTPKEVDPAKAKLRTAAEEVAFKWVNDMRLAHVMDAMDADYMLVNKMDKSWAIEDTKGVVQRMIADIRREGEGEEEFDKLVMKHVGSRTAHLYQAWLADSSRLEVAI